jgi:choline dehydrogenase
MGQGSPSRSEPDVVVVGGGSAGCAMAALLAAAPSRSVLLLEAGPDLRASPPGAMHDGWRTYRDADWGYESQPNDRGETEQLFRGRVVGGSSWMTRFVMRGSPEDFGEWDRLGIPGWSWDDVLPAFVRLEDDLDFGAEPWHGQGGPLTVTRYPDVPLSPFESALVEACAAAGIELIDDHNRPGAVGAARMPRNSRNGIRVTSADAYLPVGDTPPSLSVQPHAEVDKVLFDDSGCAVGVRLVDGAEVRAGWVVLSAGTYGTPAILLRSGIGPARDLQALGVDVRSDLPGVGANLADHQGFDVSVGYRGEAGVAPRFFWLATFRSTAASDDEPPDLALWVPEPFGVGDDPATTDVTAVLLTPRSRGSVRLISADPRAAPAIALPGLRSPVDVARLAEGARIAADVAAAPALRRLCDNAAAGLPHDARALRSELLREAWSFPHVVGTCAMGPDQASAVVDSSGEVYGSSRLTVADASIIPTAPSGFPHVMALMIAERMAERLDERI